ncbi:hypothetical protein M433DRAFT_154303 [Acidomyces richmondensis BFW]|nr:MAG: hypothetical protein FE78DRAFT_90373 [Acidomyces sp. 'richmondensis']KYG45633.1 hypothetical protein M433DRAFT_154303 [Acidomyces richmondensis BFW]
MGLSISPATAEDLEDAKTICGIDPFDGGFASPLVRMCWPISNPHNVEVLRRRAEWSMAQQLDILRNDPSVRMTKVVDDTTGEIVNLARWQDYSEGYVDPPNTPSGVSGIKDTSDISTWPEELQVERFLDILKTLFAARQNWMGRGKYWVLTTMVTREPYRKRGAGSLTLEWGLEQARKDGIPVFLEAAPAAKRLYEKHGWRQVGKQVSDIGGQKIEIARMRADP